jgi:hypothetical protein
VTALETGPAKAPGYGINGDFALMTAYNSTSTAVTFQIFDGTGALVSSFAVPPGGTVNPPTPPGENVTYVYKVNGVAVGASYRPPIDGSGSGGSSGGGTTPPPPPPADYWAYNASTGVCELNPFVSGATTTYTTQAACNAANGL